MVISDECLIINNKLCGEDSRLISGLTPNHGLIKGFVKINKKNGFFEIGNLVEVNLFFREGLTGKMTGEAKRLFSYNCMDNRAKILAISIICSLLNHSLREDDKLSDYSPIFQSIVSYLNKLCNINERFIFFELMIIIKNIIQFLGYEFRLGSCIVTKTSDIDKLTYISPKSAHAVCLEAGRPYDHLMLKLPKSFITNNCEDITGKEDMVHIKRIIIFFLEKSDLLPNFYLKKLFSDLDNLLNMSLKN